jgi:hypothetical protein
MVGFPSFLWWFGIMRDPQPQITDVLKSIDVRRGHPGGCRSASASAIGIGIGIGIGIELLR